MSIRPVAMTLISTLALTVSATAAPFAYITGGDSRVVWVVDLATNARVLALDGGQTPYGVAVNRTGTRVYTTDVSSGRLFVEDAVTNTLIGTVSIAFPAFSRWR